MKVKTSELQGTALDWAVAKCEGHPGLFDVDAMRGIKVYLPFDEFEYFEPSINWEQSGPIIEREGINLRALSGALWEAETWSAEGNQYLLDGPTPLIAVMRCYVASRLGDEIELPEELK
jgi:hypothetical protein